MKKNELNFDNVNNTSNNNLLDTFGTFLLDFKNQIEKSV